VRYGGSGFRVRGEGFKEWELFTLSIEPPPVQIPPKYATGYQLLCLSENRLSLKSFYFPFCTRISALNVFYGEPIFSHVATIV